jgi:3-hydroxyacyl-[acyl-carrier protein] dehydratase/trans-2-decenoyl-[acyl-carrier protein] isomerase
MNIQAPTAVRPFPKKNAYNEFDMLAFANREFGDDLPPLPMPPWLMLHRIIDASETGGDYGNGYAIAEYDVWPNAEYFNAHFKGNPVMPGCLGVDAVQQLTGFVLAWAGARGDGIALGFGKTRYRGMVKPLSGTLRIRADVKQLKLRPTKLSVIVASGWVQAQGGPVYEMDDVMVGVNARPSA